MSGDQGPRVPGLGEGDSAWVEGEFSIYQRYKWPLFCRVWAPRPLYCNSLGGRAGLSSLGDGGQPRHMPPATVAQEDCKGSVSQCSWVPALRLRHPSPFSRGLNGSCCPGALGMAGLPGTGGSMAWAGEGSGRSLRKTSLAERRW